MLATMGFASSALKCTPALSSTTPRPCFGFGKRWVAKSAPTSIRNDLFWQGIDAVVAVRTLGDATYHVHAKDVDFNAEAVRRNGVLDTTPLEKIEARSWSFRTVGHGHDSLLWKRFFGALREVGYDDVISIEHEDILASAEEGLVQAVAFLKSCLFTEPRPQPWWTS